MSERNRWPGWCAARGRLLVGSLGIGLALSSASGAGTQDQDLQALVEAATREVLAASQPSRSTAPASESPRSETEISVTDETGVLAGLNELALGFLEEEAELVRTERTITTAAGYAQRVDRTPSNVYVISREMIDSVNPKHPAEMLRFVPGFTVLRRQQYSYEVSAFGTGSGLANKVLVLIDGHRATDPNFGNVNYNTLPLVTDEIDRIEIVLGPESVQYGSGAFAAVVNFLTQMPAEETGGKIAIRAGGAGFDQEVLTHASKYGRGATRITALRDRRSATNGFQILNGGQETRFLAGDSVAQESLRMTHQYEFNRDTKMAFSASQVESQSDGVPLGSFQLPRSANSDQESQFLTLDLNHSLSSDRQLKLKVDYYRVNRNFSIAPLAALGTPDTNFDVAQREAELRYRFAAGPWKLTLGAGHRSSDVAGAYVNPGDALETDNFLVHGERAVGEKLVLFLGARTISQNFASDDTSWKVAGLYRPRRDLGLRLSVGTSFRQPDLIGLRFRTSTRFLGQATNIPFTIANPNIKNSAAGDFVQLGIEKLWDRSSFKLDLYRADLEDFGTIAGAGPAVTAAVPFPPFLLNLGRQISFINVALDQRVKGFTFAYQRDLPAGMDLKITGYWQDLENGNQSAENIGVPPRAATVLLSRPAKGSGLGGSLAWVAVDQIGNGDTQRRNGGPETIPGYGYVDLNLERAISDAATIGLTVHNVFDKDHVEINASGISNDTVTRAAGFGREVYLTYKQEF